MACPEAIKQLPSVCCCFSQSSCPEPGWDWLLLVWSRSWGERRAESLDCPNQNILLPWQRVRLFSSNDYAILTYIFLRKQLSAITNEKFNHNYLRINFLVDSVNQTWIVITLVCLNFLYCPDFKPITLNFWFGQATEKTSGSLEASNVCTVDRTIWMLYYILCIVEGVHQTLRIPEGQGL